MREVLTHSKRLSFKTCRRHYKLRHEDRLALRTQKPGRRRGAIFGDAIFAANNAYADPIDAAQASVDAAYAALQEQAQNTNEWNGLDVERVKVRVMAAMYVAKYGNDSRREIEYVLPLKNPKTNRGGRSRTFDVGGKIDGVVVLGPKHVRLIEDKFVGQIQKAMIDRLPLDDQITEYSLAFRAKGWTTEVAYRHTRVPGINPLPEIIPPAFTPSGKPSTAKGRPAETMAEFEMRVVSTVSEGIDSYLDEQIVLLTDAHFADYEAGRWQVAQDIVLARRFDSFYKNPSRCWEWGGCEYIPLCTMREGAENLYVVTEDNPELSRRDDGTTSEYAGQ